MSKKTTISDKLLRSMAV